MNGSFQKRNMEEKPPRLKCSKMPRIWKGKSAELSSVYLTRLLELLWHYLKKFQELRILRKSSKNWDFFFKQIWSCDRRYYCNKSTDIDTITLKISFWKGMESKIRLKWEERKKQRVVPQWKKERRKERKKREIESRMEPRNTDTYVMGKDQKKERKGKKRKKEGKKEGGGGNFKGGWSCKVRIRTSLDKTKILSLLCGTVLSIQEILSGIRR